jgi:hypothetical protein
MLAEALDELESSHPEVSFFRLDVAELISDGIANPSAYGFTNVADPAAPGLNPGALFYNSSRIVDNPNEYLFWDEIHPTATAHAVLAQRAFEALRTPADFDFDWDVDNDDLLQGQGDFGLNANSDSDRDDDSDGADFLVWQQLHGKAMSHSTAAPVPEPATIALLVGCILVGLLQRP